MSLVPNHRLWRDSEQAYRRRETACAMCAVGQVESSLSDDVSFGCGPDTR